MRIKRVHPHSDLESQSEAFGLVAWLEQTRVVLPLKGVDCKFDICGGIADVRIDQVFHQVNAQPLNCFYTFPLPARAAVYQCEMHVNGRVIVAKVEEQGEARRIVDRRQAAGFRTALVEIERGNVFSLSLGNVQPGDVVVIRLAYFQTVERLDAEHTLRIPFSPGIRYIPGRSLLRENQGIGTADDTDQVPDASRITPPRIDRFHPDAAQLGIEGRIRHLAGAQLEISSPSHLLRVTPNEKESRIDLAESKLVPDRDLVVRWTERLDSESLQPGAWIASSAAGEAEACALVELHAPARATGADGFEQDVYFLVDRSGSMEGEKWIKAVEAFRAFLGNLGQNDRVFATFFETEYQDLVEKPHAPAALLKDRGVRELESLGTGGGTELLPALRHVLDVIARDGSDRHRSLIVITDGQVGNERGILDVLESHPELRVHTFGIDTNVNDSFLEEMAGQQRGTCCLRTPSDDIAGAIAGLGARMTSPVLTSLEIEGAWDSAGEKLPDLFAGEVLALPLRSAGRNPATREIRVRGRLPDGTPWSHRFQATPVTNPAIGMLWAQRRIRHLIASGKPDEAIVLAKEKNILCQGTSFVAWDEAEKVARANPLDTLYQPSFESHARICFAPVHDADDANFSLPFDTANEDWFRSFLHRSLSSEYAGDAPSRADGRRLQKVLKRLRAILKRLDKDRGPRLAESIERHFSASAPYEADVEALEELADLLEQLPALKAECDTLCAGARERFAEQREKIRVAVEFLSEDLAEACDDFLRPHLAGPEAAIA